MQTLTIDFWELAALTLLRFSISLMLSLSPHLRGFHSRFNSCLNANCQTTVWMPQRKPRPGKRRGKSCIRHVPADGTQGGRGDVRPPELEGDVQKVGCPTLARPRCHRGESIFKVAQRHTPKVGRAPIGTAREGGSGSPPEWNPSH